MDRLSHILLVEDNQAERYLFQKACSEGKLTSEVHEVIDGAQALDYLHKRNGFEGVPTPDVVVLDLNLPKMSGYDVLAELKSDATLRTIPVVILSVSDAEEDVRKAYELGAAAYIAKPSNVDEFFRAVRETERFWLTIATLPSRHSLRGTAGL